MNEDAVRYVLDTTVFIEAHRRYYAFKICPGFWEAIIHYQRDGLLISTTENLREIMAGNKPDELKDWIKTKVPKAFFARVTDKDVVDAYEETINWVNEQDYSQAAKNDYMNEPDAWVIAYAKAKKRCVVSEEVSEKVKKGEIKIPNVCRGLTVPHINTFDLLGRLGVELRWEQ